MDFQDFPDPGKALWPANDVDPQPNRERPHPTTLSDQQLQQSNNALPPLTDGVGQNWEHNGDFDQSPLGFDNLDIPPEFVSANNLQNVNPIDLSGHQPQTTAPDEYQQWDLQDPSQLFQASDPTALLDANSWPTPVGIEQHTDIGFSALAVETFFEPTAEIAPLDFSLLDLFAPTAHQSQNAYPNLVVQHPTASNPDNIPGLEITTPSQPITITSRPGTQRLLLPKESVLLPTQSLSSPRLLRCSRSGSSKAAQSGQMSQKGSRKRRNDSPTVGAQLIKMRKSGVPPQMIQCLKLGLPSNSGLQPHGKNKKPCLMCRMHKKQCAGGYPCEYCEERLRQAVGRRCDRNVMFTGCIESDLRDMNIFLDAIARTYPTVKPGNLLDVFLPRFSSTDPKLLNRAYLRYNANEDEVFHLLLKPFSFTTDHCLVLMSLIDRIGEYIVRQTDCCRMLAYFSSRPTEYDLIPPGAPSVNELLTFTHPSKPLWVHIEMLAWFAAFRHRKAISDFIGVDEHWFYGCISLLALYEQEFARYLINNLNEPRKQAHVDKLLEWIRLPQMIIFLEASIQTYEAFVNTGGKTLQRAELAELEKIDHFKEFCRYHTNRYTSRWGDGAIEAGRFFRTCCAEISEMDLTHWPRRGLLLKSLSEMTPDRAREQLKLFEDELQELLSACAPTELGLKRIEFLLDGLRRLLSACAPAELDLERITLLLDGLPEYLRVCYRIRLRYRGADRRLPRARTCQGPVIEVLNN